MKTRPFDQTLYEVAAETLESLAMMCLAPQDDTPTPLPACDRHVVAAFTGPFDGTMTLAVSSKLLPELAANMLGLAPPQESIPEQQVDALKELANVICGNVLPAIAGSEPVFHVSAPELLAQPMAPTAATGDWAGKVRLVAEAGVLEVGLLLSRHPAGCACA